jgi:hypothetical protein
MAHAHRKLGGLVLLALAAVLAPGTAAVRADDRAEIEALKREVEALRRSDAEKQRQLDELRRMLERLLPAAAAEPPREEQAPERALRDIERAGPETALDQAVRGIERAEAPPAAPLDRAVRELPVARPAPSAGELWSRQIGAGRLRLLDLSLDVLTAAGTSTEPESSLRTLQGGAHDPNRRGFTLQQAELSLMGAVDPYLTGEAHVIFTPDVTELEEAFLTTQALPWGLQLEAGHFFTEFGRINPLHPHAWDWIDQPVINSRLFGGDGLRAPGVRLGWLTPLPWFSELHVGAQNANEDETTVSFLADEGIGGRPAVRRDVRNLKDLLYLTRWVNSWNATDDVTALAGVSGLFGPNSTGGDARTFIYGGDLTVTWRPADNFRGWPFLKWQSELTKRDYTAAHFLAGTAGGDGGGHGHDHGEEEEEDDGDDFDEDIAGDILRDWGLYTQLLWGFHYRWATGLRYEYASGSGPSLGGRFRDPFRDERHRISPLLVWQPTEYSRFRLQYNVDRAGRLDDTWAHTVWVGAEILYGAHPAHSY